ncbi:diaminopimelate decarboxylase [Breznakia sp. PF5-3]|uniref:diaminopimelate decarboxylase n=1 Tax=unclassified Breznakia TaxID=2623764 RepID=UPI002405CDDE|nr:MULTISPECIES: diaminopimelate decarboxylase [unclassified Breznakia]MDF9823691.1 diaminopimelate decarboxylase [Breznakia sp. PM6-1]MDF9834489.1 diaminopimelate decarboxylase [Breznakia sp. PF5-3]MDF9837540.1 diaminopimelate decarboxylase [Breznakia sp. PFB2-8]MDF9859117.1 diaminopimelate decarboxylase [Breznakia sp. PH5-24]
MLKIGNVGCDELLHVCGSPLYVYDEKVIEDKLQEYQTYFKSDKFETEIVYASKAFTCGALLKKLAAFQCSIDVVSGGELYVAERAAFNPDKIYFHGNNKTDDEVKMALTYGVKTLVIDNVFEVEKILSISKAMKKHVHVLIRINPKIEAHTHEYIMTATSDSKFGISIDEIEDIVSMINMIEASEYVTFDGFHSHIGSQIFEAHAFIGAIDKMVVFAKKIKDITGVNIKTLNIGGGFGVRYTDEDTPLSTPEMCKALIQAIEIACDNNNITFDKVCMEPGRSIVGEAGYTLYEVGFTKKTQNKEFAFINGGMADNIRPALYEAKYACDIANKMDETKEYRYEIAGKCCESGDILIHDVLLPKVETGDILVTYTTGAYGYSMASNYNRLNRPAVVFVKDGKVRQVLRRETYEDQVRLDDEREIKL